MKLEKIKDFLKKNKILSLITIIIIIVILFFIFKNGHIEDNSIISPTFGNFTESVSATGQVVSNVDLNLSFEKQGIVKTINVEVGDKVKKGQILAKLDTTIEYAKITEMKASLAIAEAKLKKILDGASGEEINLAKVNLENAKIDFEKIKKTQETLVKNAYDKLLNSTLEAESLGGTGYTIKPTISGTYNLAREGSITIKTYSTSNGIMFSTFGLVNSMGNVDTNNPQSIGGGLYILFPSSSYLSDSSWIINIPNKRAQDYLINQNAYESALQTKDNAISSGESLIKQKEAELLLKQAQARGADIALGEAEILSAKSALERAFSDYEKSILRAPNNGTITKVDVKYGELSNVQKPVITLQDISNLYVKANINESNIASIKLNQPVSIVFDSLPKEKFTGIVSHIDPSSLAKDGIVDFEIKISILEKNENIRPGMNAEITIIISNKENVLSIPRASIIKKDNKFYVKTITDMTRKTIKEKEIIQGGWGDGNMVEILSGLNKDDKIIFNTDK